jgi:hypothetical protein
MHNARLRPRDLLIPLKIDYVCSIIEIELDGDVSVSLAESTTKDTHLDGLVVMFQVFLGERIPTRPRGLGCPRESQCHAVREMVARYG